SVGDVAHGDRHEHILPYAWDRVGPGPRDRGPGPARRRRRPRCDYLSKSRSACACASARAVAGSTPLSVALVTTARMAASSALWSPSCGGMWALVSGVAM